MLHLTAAGSDHDSPPMSTSVSEGAEGSQTAATDALGGCGPMNKSLLCLIFTQEIFE